MTKKKLQFLKFLQLLTFTLCFPGLNAQTSVNFKTTIQNIVQTSDRTLEFDIYLLNTEAGNTMELASYQAGIKLNSGIYSGGTLTASIVSGSSTLTNTGQVPTSITYTASAAIIKIGAKAPPGAGSGSIISQVSPGTRIIRVKLTSSVHFTSNTTTDLLFAPSTDLPPSYPTAVALYVNGINTQLPVAMGNNAFVNENPKLNPPITIFSVTGGGSYCRGAGGSPVGLNNSEIGVSYTLFKNTVEQSLSQEGTGTSISFGNQLSGEYTIRGANIGGTKFMTGAAIIEEIPLPSAPVIDLITQPTCALETGAVLLTGLPVGAWTINPGNLSGSGTSRSVSGLSPSQYTFIVTSSGCTSAQSANVVIDPQPITPPKPSITPKDNYLESSSGIGNQWYNSSGLITGATEQKYYASVNGNYYVIVTSSEGCSSEPSDIISFTTEIEMKDLFEGIILYPNPATEYLIIENSSLVNSIDFEILNSNGKVIKRSKLNQTGIIDVSLFSPGTYYIRFLNLNSHHQLKFIKQ